MKSRLTKPGFDAIMTLEDLHGWIEQELDAPKRQKLELRGFVNALFDRERDSWQQAKFTALRDMQASFADKLAHVRHEVDRRDTTVATITRHFEEVVAELSERARRDPKTKLLHGTCFMERIESFLAVERRAAWSALGIIDLRHFKRINDNLGHAVGDVVIATVACILSEQLRSGDSKGDDDFRSASGRDLHARLGGDEFSFFIPSLARPDDAVRIATRFKTKLEAFDWPRVDAGLQTFPVTVDVGVVCLRLGNVVHRRPSARTLAEELVMRADRLMYGAKHGRSDTVASLLAGVEGGQLVELETQHTLAAATPSHAPGEF
ncbi:MAG: GGDEF domain-containing protein [Vicinamibacterales bacterium]